MFSWNVLRTVLLREYLEYLHFYVGNHEDTPGTDRKYAAISACLFHLLMLCCALICSNIVERMYDSSTGIKLTRNLDQGNRYKETFTGTSGRQRATSHLKCHTAGTRELLYCLQSGISSGPVGPGSAAKLSNTFLTCSLDVWKHTKTPDFWSTLYFSDTLWDGAKMFLPVKAYVAGDPQRSTLSWYESCLSCCRFCPGGLAHLQQLCRVPIRGRHLGVHADG